MVEPQSVEQGVAKPHWGRRLHGVIVVTLLIVVLLLGLGSSLHSRMLSMGEQIWPGYYTLNPSASQPTCEYDVDIERRVQEEMEAEEDDGFDLGGDMGPDEDSIRRSIERNLERCERSHRTFEQQQERITPMLVAYKGVERSMAKWLTDNMGLSTYLFIILMGIGAGTAAFSNEHIALRPPLNRVDWRVSQGAQLLVNCLMVYSINNYLFNLTRIPDTDSMQSLQNAWITVFSLLAMINLFRLVKIPDDLPQGRLTLTSTLVPPLYCVMGFTGFMYFVGIGNLFHPEFAVNWNSAGLGVYINQMTGHANLFINIGLYVFVGMMLKQTTIPERLLKAVHPWQLPPAALASLVIFATAFPTAFTGASGIFILAVGGTIYDELRRAGAGRQLSLATTAMSGSLGVVLNPCLLIVVIAALNREVTTVELYSVGFWVFILSASLFSFTVCATEGEWKPRAISKRRAAMESLRALKPLIPYVVMIIAVVLFFRMVLGVRFDEYTAPMILPVVMLMLVLMDSKKGMGRVVDWGRRISIGASESAVHAGALLILIGLSMSVGGILERSDLVSAIFPDQAGSIWLVMLALVIMLTIIGMFMDPFAAVVLVSATIASPAIGLGVDPLHFWIVTLVAFELGYLTPPVALNHLLTRQVVGAREALIPELEGSFYQRYQRLLLPLLVMSITLMLVAFVPVFFYS
ncbi:MAG: TRAP transporter large permease subunit [Halomonadaceae bacterium]|nr:MAG: TRAP transporter large permease subunit [Halomonadaceae bacterium]